MKRAAFSWLLVVLTLGALGCSRSEPPPPAKSAPAPPAAHSAAPSAPAARGVPPYYESAEAARPFPPLVPAAYFRDYPLVARAYQIASEIPEVIAQQPCYCYCDKLGHRSLLDCYASDHGAG